MIGTLTFDSAGNLIGQSAYTIKDTDTSTPDSIDLTDSNNPGNLQNWQPADFNIEGYPICTANFLGNEGGDATNMENAKNIALDFGAYSQSASWPAGTGNADGVGTNAQNLPSFEDMKLVPCLLQATVVHPPLTHRLRMDILRGIWNPFLLVETELSLAIIPMDKYLSYTPLLLRILTILRGLEGKGEIFSWRPGNLVQH